MSSATAKRHVAKLNAAILIARTILRSSCGSSRPAWLARIETRVRYVHLLALRSKLGPVTSLRLTLAAWLSGLDDQPDIQSRMAIEHDVTSLLQGQSDDLPGRIMRLVTLYQEAMPLNNSNASQMPSLTGKHPSDNNDKTLWRRFTKLLADEQVLGLTDNANARILIVDPDEYVTPVIMPILVRSGFDTDVVGHADNAQARMDKAMPDAIIASARLPVVSGIEMCRQLKKGTRTASIPIIIMLERRQKHAERDALMAGANETFVKPVDTDALLIKLNRLLTTEKKLTTSVSPDSKGGVNGTLQSMPLTDMLQILAAGGKSMRIALSREAEAGEIIVSDGAVSHALKGENVGSEAFYQLMKWKEGAFCITPCDPPVEKTVHESLMALLIEGSRLMDEEKTSELMELT